MQFTIFTIDFQHDPMRMNVFNNWLTDLGISFQPAIGCYKGERENAYIVGRTEFDTYIRGCVAMADQENVLHVASGNKRETEIEMLADGRTYSIGCMHQVCKEEADLSDNWTYRPDMGAYWIAKRGNPDGSYRRSVEMYQDTSPVFDRGSVGAALAAE